MLAAGQNIRIREVRAGDEDAIVRLLGGLDAQSRYRRWFTAGVDIVKAEDWAAHPKRAHAIGLLAFISAAPAGHAVLIPLADGRGEVAFEVAAPWRRHGIAGALLDRLLEVAADRGLREIYADVLPENADMLAVLREHGTHSETHAGGIVTVTLPVPDKPAGQAPSSSLWSSA
jgi:GNAT superfamily N-acetyltransferase